MSMVIINGMEMKTDTDDCGTSFKYQLAWEVLQKHPKFMVDLDDGCVQPQTRIISKDEADCIKLEDVDSIVSEVYEGPPSRQFRPIGRRKAKDQLKRDDMACKKS